MKWPVLAVLAVLALLPLAGCGFEPLYARGTDNPNGDLHQVYVNNIGGRYGQLVRESLQQRLDLPVSGPTASTPSTSTRACRARASRSSPTTPAPTRAWWAPRAGR